MAKKTVKELLRKAKALEAEQQVWIYLRERLDTDLSVPENDPDQNPRVVLPGVVQDDVDHVIEQVEETLEELASELQELET
jgi:hypothetical protein